MRIIVLAVEALSNVPNAALLQIAAVDNEGKEFNVHIDVDSCTQQGLKISHACLRAPSHADVPQRLSYALHAFNSWLGPANKPRDIQLWGAGYAPIMHMAAAYAAFGWEVPWFYNDVRDLNTLALAPATTLCMDALIRARAQLVELTPAPQQLELPEVE